MCCFCVWFFLFVIFVLTSRAQAVQGAQLQVQQVHHPQRHLPLLPCWQGQRTAEKQDCRGQNSMNQQLHFKQMFASQMAPPYSIIVHYFWPGSIGHYKGNRGAIWDANSDNPCWSPLNQQPCYPPLRWLGWIARQSTWLEHPHCHCL